MILLVCGGRDYADGQSVDNALRAFARGDVVLVQGGARGADSLAALCRGLGVAVIEVSA